VTLLVGNLMGRGGKMKNSWYSLRIQFTSQCTLYQSLPFHFLGVLAIPTSMPLAALADTAESVKIYRIKLVLDGKS